MDHEIFRSSMTHIYCSNSFHATTRLVALVGPLHTKLLNFVIISKVFSSYVSNDSFSGCFQGAVNFVESLRDWFDNSRDRTFLLLLLR